MRSPAKNRDGQTPCTPPRPSVVPEPHPTLDWSPYPLIRPRELAGPFAVIGALGSVILMLPFASRPRDENLIAAALIALVTTGAAALVGAKLSRSAGDRWHLLAFDLVATTLALGATAGGVFGAITFFGGLYRGAMYGFLAALPFVPAFAVVLAAVRRGGRARVGTMMARAERRAVWSAAAAATSVLCGLCAGCKEDFTGVAVAVSLLALLALVAMFAFDVGAFRRASRVVRACEARPLLAAAEGLDAPVAFDLGLGDDRRGVITAPSYRVRAAVSGVMRGDPRATMRALGAELAWSGASLAFTAGVVAALFHAGAR
jgi:hypothetical protein